MELVAREQSLEWGMKTMASVFPIFNWREFLPIQYWMSDKQPDNLAAVEESREVVVR